MTKFVEDSLLTAIGNAAWERCRMKKGKLSIAALEKIAEEHGYTPVEEIKIMRNIVTDEETSDAKRKGRVDSDRRFELIKAAVTGILSNPVTLKTAEHGTSISRNAIAMADAVMEKLAETPKKE